MPLAPPFELHFLDAGDQPSEHRGAAEGERECTLGDVHACARTLRFRETEAPPGAFLIGRELAFTIQLGQWTRR
jgi:hypothetical protein